MGKRLSIIVMLTSLVLSFATAQEAPAVSPIYSYASMSSGYGAILSDQPYVQAIPLGVQTGVLSNSDDGRLALGFGTRMDMEFGITDGSDFSIDMLMGMECMYRFSRNVALDFMLGLAVGIVDTASTLGDVVTMGPGAAALVRFTPSHMNLVSLDIGMAAYAHIGIDTDYIGASLVPFIGITFDFTGFPYLALPHYAAHILVY